MKLRHAIKIAASRERTFRALTNLNEMNMWHSGELGGTIAPGAVLHLRPKPGLNFAWRTEFLEPDTLLVQTCVEGPRTGKTLRFDLSEANGYTLLELTDGEWPDDDPHLPFCNTHWGKVLHDLKSYVEREK